MIHFLPIEPLWQRYSEQWLGWFQREFRRLEVPFTTYMGDHVGDIGTGQFLDVYGTHIFKFTQLAHLIDATKKGVGIKDGDTVFLMDMWFPGLEALAYIRQGAGIHFKICGILHDGTYNPADFLHQRGMAGWGQSLEESWFTFVDKIFVATHFHKGFLYARRRVNPDKVLVTGLPFYPDECSMVAWRQSRSFDVCFPHRLAPEKAPEKFDDLILQTGLKGWRKIRSEPMPSKQDYYRSLAGSEVAVSFAEQEMFGISMLEACANGCLPLVPDRLAYSEMYPDVFKYSPDEEENLKPRIDDLIARRKELEPLARSIAARYTGAIENMVHAML